MRMPSLRVFNQRDERTARELRERLGPSGRLVSWSQEESDDPYPQWIARVSGPELPETFERRGRSRCRAILNAIMALDHELMVRAQAESE